MADPDMLHCVCGYTCGTRAALEKHIGRFGPDCEDHKVDPEPLSPLRQPRGAPRLRLDSCHLDSPALGMSWTSAATTVPPSPMTPLSPQIRRSLYSQQAVSPSSAQTGVRLLLVRHAQSANKSRQSGQRAAADPELSDLGYEQAQALGRRLAEEFGEGTGRRLRVVCSPMRRCLLTIQPAVQLLRLPPESCLCHGACYEYGCAGNSAMGSTAAEIAQDFPEFMPVGFGVQGCWDYAGESDKENEPECRDRATRVVQWLKQQAEAEREAAVQEGGLARTVLLTTHQTVADLLCHLLLYGRADEWSYGEITHKLQNACITEVFLHPDGRASFGFQNEHSHLMSLRFRLSLV